MKKIIGLCVALLGVAFLLNVNAQSPDVTLEITYGELTCTYPTAVDLGDYASPNVDTPTTAETWDEDINCEDLMGPRSGDFLMSTTDLANGTLDSIPSSNVVYTPAGLITQNLSGDCGTAIDEGAGGTLSGDVSLLTKSDGSACTWSYAPAGLVATIPAFVAVGMYTGTITITEPLPVI